MDRSEMLDVLAGEITAIDRTHAVRVAIDGPTAAGKTMLADELASHIEQLGRPVIRLSIDGFHHPRAHRYHRGESPEAYYDDSFNYAAVRSHVLEPLGPDGSGVYVPAVFDFRTDSHIEAELAKAPDDAILLFDGVMLLRDELDDYWDYRIHVHVETATSADRAGRRDAEHHGSTESARQRYLGRYMPGQKHYAKHAHPHQRADAVIVNDDPQAPQLLRSAPNGDNSSRTG